MSERSRIFGSEAEAYDDLRPGYPADVVDMIVDDDPSLVVDAGCGTGIAARLVSSRGVDVLGVEPDASMARVAEAHGIRVELSAFEEWRPVPCDVVYAAQSWHWIDPVAGARVAAAALRSGGRWLGVWNVESDREIHDRCQSVFADVAPELLDDDVALHLGATGFRERIDDGFGVTSAFEPSTRERVRWTDSVTVERFVDRLGTHSAHRMLPSDRRRRVRDRLIDALRPGSVLEVGYVTEVLIARRR